MEIAGNGVWGLKLAKEKIFDIIILDMVMPALDGFGVIKELKASVKTNKLPIIVLSNSAQDKDIEQAREAGAGAYLVKSKLTPSQLVEEIKKLLGS